MAICTFIKYIVYMHAYIGIQACNHTAKLIVVFVGCIELEVSRVYSLLAAAF